MGAAAVALRRLLSLAGIEVAIQVRSIKMSRRLSEKQMDQPTLNHQNFKTIGEKNFTREGADVPTFATENVGTSEKRVEAPKSTINPASLPSTKRPFIFFHIPKCGGSTLRDAFVQGGKAVARRTFAPCYDNVPCHTNEDDLVGTDFEEKASKADIFAGHFTTKLLKILNTISNSASNNFTRNWDLGPSELPPMDCLVSIREPIARFISHYYHFTAKSNPQFQDRKIRDLTESELAELVSTKSGGNVSVKYLSGHLSHVQPSKPDDFTWDEKVAAAENMLHRCVIILVEEWDTSARLAEAQIPWLESYLSSAQSRNVAKTRHEKENELFANQMAILKKLLHADLDLYKTAVAIYKRRLRDYGFSEVRSRWRRALARLFSPHWPVF